MAKLLKLRRGTTSQHNTFTGAEGEVTVDTTKDTAVIHDGSTTGGTPLAKEDMSNVSSASIAGRLGADSIATTKIAGGALPTDVTVASANIVDGTIVNADIASNAAIAGTKLENSGVTAGQYGSSSAIPIVTVDAQGLVTAASTTAIDSTKIQNGTTEVSTANNGDITMKRSGTTRVLVDNGGVDITGDLSVSTNGSFVGTMSAQSFTTTSGGVIINSTQPTISMVDSDGSPDYQIKVNGGVFDVRDSTNNASRFSISAAGETTSQGKLNCQAGLDTDGNVTFNTGTTNVGVEFNAATSNMNFSDGMALSFGDHSTTGDYNFSYVNGTEFGILAMQGGSQDLVIGRYENAATKKHIVSTRAGVAELYHDNSKKLNTASGGIDVTGNITVTGTVDGVDVANLKVAKDSLSTSNGVILNGVTATTQSAGDNSTKIATTAYTDTAVANLVDSSPGALNTLNELAAAINDDASFSTTVNNNIATKMPLSGGEFTGNVTCENIVPDSDSSRNLGSNSVRFANVYADNFYGSGANLTGAFLSGMIMMYNSSSAPSGWNLCNGSNGTPDLRDRFIVGAGNSYSHGATGGSVTATDTANINVSVSGSTSGGGSYSFNAGIFRAAGHTVAASGHQHSFSGSGSGSDTISIDTRSPYYALTFIMKS